MRVLLYSDAGDLLWMAMRLQREGHAVELLTEDPHAQHLGQRMVPRTEHPQTTPDTLIVFDGTGHGELGALYRKAGYAVIGGNPMDVALEVDRAQAIALAESVGMRVPLTRVFRDVPAAAAFLLDQNEEWFFKLSGSHLSCAYTYNDPDPKALSRFLQWVAPHVGPTEGVLLQQRVSGIECDVEGLFDGAAFIPGSFTATLEDKRYGIGSRGPRTGCQSNVVWTLAEPHPLIASTVGLWADLLRASRYVGPFSVNSIFTPTGPVFLECTARFGFDATQASHGLLLNGNLGDTLHAWARGQIPTYPYRTDVLAATVRISTLPFPVEAVAAAEEMLGLPLGSLWLTDPTTFADDIMQDERGDAVLAGRDGNVGCVGMVGTDWEAMREALDEKAEQMGVPHAQWFPVVERAVEAWMGLSSLGYLPESDLPLAALKLAA